MDSTYMENLKNGYDMLYLAACALQETVPEDAVVKAMDLKAVYRQAKKQMLPAITCYSIEKWIKQTEDAIVDPQLLEKWKDTKNRAIRKNMMLDMEREKLLAFMENRGIWYMPLKGSIVKDWYPQMGMRQMSDNDILFNSEFLKDIDRYMKDGGFKQQEHKGITHVCYHKKPLYNFEMHTRLFGYNAKPEWREYYKNVKERLCKDEDNQFGYHFTDEDMYVYMTTHACKHFNTNGHGVRNLLDVCVFLKTKPTMDWSYIQTELEKLNLKQHEEQIRALAQKILNLQWEAKREAFTLQEEEFLSICLSVGAYGNYANRTEMALSTMSAGEKKSVWTRIKYLYARLIPNQALLEELYPSAAKYKILKPFYILRRISFGLRKKRKVLWRECLVILGIRQK